MTLRSSKPLYEVFKFMFIIESWIHVYLGMFEFIFILEFDAKKEQNWDKFHWMMMVALILQEEIISCQVFYVYSWNMIEANKLA